MEKLNRVVLLDDSNRPKATKVVGLTPAQRRQGRRLSLYHNMHRQQLREVAQSLREVAAGAAPDGLSASILRLDMSQNFRAFGNLCGQECEMLTFHHTAEDQMLFPTLNQKGDPALRKVVERLQAEHLVVHGLIEELERGSLHLIEQPSTANFETVKASFEMLSNVVHSHFGYEEEELEDALSIIDVGI